MSARALRCTAALAALAVFGAVPRPQAGGVPWSPAALVRLRRAIDGALAAAALRGAHVGVLAVDTERGTLLYARGADDEFLPASNFKLLVGSVALAQLGTGFAYVTTVSADAPPRGGTIVGNLYLRGGGDATLRAADLRAAAVALQRAGVRSVTGALVTDASHFDAQRYAPGWSVDDIPYGYAAVVSALELEDGVVHVYVSPGGEPGEPARLRIEPASAAFTIVDDAVTGEPHTADTTDVRRPWNAPTTIEIVGSYPAGAAESDDLSPAVPDPARYAGDVLRQALRAQGIAVAGDVRAGTTPPGAVALWRHASAPLPQLLADFWLPSDNLMGELLLKEIGAQRAGEPGSAAAGIAVERSYLQSLHVDLATLSIADGSGGSIYDRLTPRDLVAILQHDWNAPHRDIAIDALPEAGVRGTLQDAFAGTALAGALFAKTGTYGHTRTLSGFLQTPAHGPVTFSLLIDDWLGDDAPEGPARLRRAQAAILSAFLTAGS